MNDKQKRADELQERLIDFAVRIIKLSSRLPKTAEGRHIAGQILGSGTSPPPNYGEARAAGSHADLLHHLSIVLRELNETLARRVRVKPHENGCPVDRLLLERRAYPFFWSHGYSFP